MANGREQERGHTKEALAARHFHEACMVIEVFDSFKAEGLQYAVLGGFALNAIVGNQYVAERKNRRKTLRDLDIIVLKYPGNTLKRLKKRIREMRRRRDITLLDVSINVAPPPEYRQKTQMSSTIKQHADGGYALVFRDLEAVVPKNLTRLERRSITMPGQTQTLTFDTFGPLMHIGRYMTRVGFIKPKNTEKVDIFVEKIKEIYGLSEEDLRGALKLFDNFARDMREEYPWHHRLMKWGIALEGRGPSLPSKLQQFILELFK